MSQETQDATAGAALEVAASDPSILDAVLREVCEGVQQVPAEPSVMSRVREISEDERAGAREIAAVIGHDPSLAGALLRYSNSAMYRGLKPVADLPTAVSRLGFKMVIATMMAEMSRAIYRFDDAQDGEMYKILWQHSVACAETARTIARMIRYPEPEQAFLAGLVHDIGKAATLVSLANLRSRGKLAWPREVALEFIEETHAIVGCEMLKRWRMPPEICNLIRDHHREISPTSSDTALALLQFSDIVCRKLGWSANPNPNTSLLAEPSATVLRLGDLTIASVLVDLEETIPKIINEI